LPSSFGDLTLRPPVALGNDQERALWRAATAAVKLTAADLHADDDKRAEGLAMVVSEVFREPVPDAPMNRIRRLTLTFFNG
jgi:hypothetical protein